MSGRAKKLGLIAAQPPAPPVPQPQPPPPPVQQQPLPQVPPPQQQPPPQVPQPKQQQQPVAMASTEECVLCPPSSGPPEAKRERELAGMLCAFCHEGEDSDDPDEDPLMPVNTGKATQHYAHENCVYWCPDVFQNEAMEWQNVGKALSRCHRLKCAVCGEVRSYPPSERPE